MVLLKSRLLRDDYCGLLLKAVVGSTTLQLSFNLCCLRLHERFLIMSVEGGSLAEKIHRGDRWRQNYSLSTAMYRTYSSLFSSLALPILSCSSSATIV